jgi:pimeloyl-ACP methyl ester carboxylesterase
MNDVLLLPGSLCDEYVWSPQIAAFSAEYRISCARLPERDTLAATAQAVLESAPPVFSLAGYALGARIALEIMRTAPDRVERLALLDASVAGVAENEAVRRQTLIDLALGQGMKPLAQHFLPQIVHPSRLADPRFMAGLTDMVCRFSPQGYQREARMLLSRPDQSPILATIRCPTLVMAGIDDPLSTADRNRTIAGGIRNAQLAFIESAAHFPSLEAAEQTNGELRRWLSWRPTAAQ